LWARQLLARGGAFRERQHRRQHGGAEPFFDDSGERFGTAGIVAALVLDGFVQ